MKAAVIEKFGDTPEYRDFDNPVPAEGDLLIRVKGVALENFDKLTASGKHYASKHMFPTFPAIVGIAASASFKMALFSVLAVRSLRTEPWENKQLFPKSTEHT
jgi:hypothetical protein